MTNVAQNQNEAPKTPAPGESKPNSNPQQQNQNAGDKPADKSNQQK
jgi:hypothetical protein